ncbi:hypothetical protein NQ318_008770, partial [Aromia moschata]
TVAPPPPPKPEPRLKTFKIYRYNPDNKDSKPFMQSYTVDLNDCRPMVLDALFKIKIEQDPTLTFRRSCREGICGQPVLRRKSPNLYSKPLFTAKINNRLEQTTGVHYSTSRLPLMRGVHQKIEGLIEEYIAKQRLSIALDLEEQLKFTLYPTLYVMKDVSLLISPIKPRGTTKIYPLPHMYVVKDLVVDFKQFYNQHHRIRPYLLRKLKAPEGKEQLLQSMQDRDTLGPEMCAITRVRKVCPHAWYTAFNYPALPHGIDVLLRILESWHFDRVGQLRMTATWNVFLCACCSTACPEYWWHGHSKEPNDFLGPSALLNAYRWIMDSRDECTKARLNDLKNFYSVFRCHQINNCTNVCPKRLKPGKAIANLRLLISGLSKKKKADMQGSSPANPDKGCEKSRCR